MALIEAEGLVRHYRVLRRSSRPLAWLRDLFSTDYRIIKALDGVSFTIDRGEIFGYIGPNGAGKSTTVKCLTGILVPTAGHVRVNGLVPYDNRKANARQIGVVFGQKTQLAWDVPVVESYKLLQSIYDIPEDRYRANLGVFDELLGLSEILHTPVRQLSLGQRMRADLAAAMLHNPAILYLDEPTIGLDVAAKYRFREFIKQLNQTTMVTVFLTTHDMADIEYLSHRIAILDNGRIIYEGDIAGTKARFGRARRLVVDLAVIPDTFIVPRATVVKEEGTRRWVEFPVEVSASDILRDLMQRYVVRDFALQEPTIEEIVRGIYDQAANRADVPQLQLIRGGGA